MKRFRPIVAIALAAALAATHEACAHREPFTSETFVMGTTAWVTIAGVSDAEAEKAAEAVFRELYRIESVMSTWRSASELSRLNADSNGIPRAVSSELFALVDSSLHYARMTFGAFDATIRPLVLLWGFQGGAPRLPSPAAIDSARALVGWERIILDPESSTITLPAGMQIDLAGIAKGYGVDRGASILSEHGITRALVNLGGNIRALGKPPGARGWRVGATSGNYENFVELGGRRFGHLIDPRLGHPVENILSVTVLAPTALAADALSTGFFILGPAEAGRALETLGGVAALFASPEGDRIAYETLGDFGGRLTLQRTEGVHEQ
jgi:thiamine biosynthesis lipoprotein